MCFCRLANADTYALYAYDAKTLVIPYFMDTAVMVVKIKPGDIEGYYQYEGTEKNAIKTALSQYHEVIKEALDENPFSRPLP